jgi:hypothetical protein
MEAQAAPSEVALKTYKDHVRESMEHERALRWSEAEKSRRAAILCLVQGGLALEGREPLPSSELYHTRHGKVLASCTYISPSEVIYKGVTYPSLGAAARAASADLGMKSKKYPALIFWGVEKQEKGRDVLRQVRPDRT